MISSFWKKGPIEVTRNGIKAFLRKGQHGQVHLDCVDLLHDGAKSSVSSHGLGDVRHRHRLEDMQSDRRRVSDDPCRGFQGTCRSDKIGLGFGFSVGYF